MENDQHIFSGLTSQYFKEQVCFDSKVQKFFLNTQYATFKIKSKEEKFRQIELVCRANHLKFENRKCQDFFLPQSKNKHAEQRPYLDKDSSVHNGFG